MQQVESHHINANTRICILMTKNRFSFVIFISSQVKFNPFGSSTVVSPDEGHIVNQLTLNRKIEKRLSVMVFLLLLLQKPPPDFKHLLLIFYLNRFPSHLFCARQPKKKLFFLSPLKFV